MKTISNRNARRYPPCKAGDEIVIVDAKIPILNNSKGIILDDSQKDRSPHKAIYKIEVLGPLSKHNPWYVFRTEFQPA